MSICGAKKVRWLRQIKMIVNDLTYVCGIDNKRQARDRLGSTVEHSIREVDLNASWLAVVDPSAAPFLFARKIKGST